MGFLKKLLAFLQRGEKTGEEPPQEPVKSFQLYMERIPEILTYFRRERGISRKNLELVLVDNEEEPVWRIERIIELLMTDLNLLYVVTGREEAFEDITERALAEHGLLIVLLPVLSQRNPSGNLELDLNDWEKHLDIISAVGYNTLIQ